MKRYLKLPGKELQRRGVTGEIVLVGGAVMLLVIGNRPTTKDIDAYFAVGTEHIRAAAQAIAAREHLPTDWINDGAKGFIMKAVAARPYDIADIEALAAHLGIQKAQDALAVVKQYVPERFLTPKTQYLIESLFE